MFSWKIMQFHLIFASLILNFASFSASTSTHRVKRYEHSDLNENFNKINKHFEIVNKTLKEHQNLIKVLSIKFLTIDYKFDNIYKKLEQLEILKNKAFDVPEIITNFTSVINDKLEEKLNKIDKYLQKMESNFNKTEKFEENLKNVDTSFTKIERKVNNLGFFMSHLLKAFNVCDPNPCHYGGRCQITTTGRGHVCECPKFTSGSHCENDECSVEKKCLRHKDTLYVVIETKVTWFEAMARCEIQGMTLAMPKDEESNLFLVNQLKPIYWATYFYLWMGLSRDAEMEAGEWQWMDGSPLGEYTGGRTDMKSKTGSLFGALYSDGGSAMWSWNEPNHKFYYLCEMHGLKVSKPQKYLNPEPL